MIGTVVNTLATLTLIGDILIVVALLLYFTNRRLLTKYLTPNSYHLSFIISLIATLGSLFFSEIAKWTPCILCWYQRILMYPQVLLLYTGILRGERVLKPYLIVLNVVGAGIAAYHYMIQRFPQTSILPCEASGASCITVQNWHYGYISIPMMALTAFILNIIVISFSDTKTKGKK